MSNKTISQIGQSLTNPSDRTLVEVELNGQSFKMELGALAGYLAARTPSEPQAATPYWINFPDYSIDSQAQTIVLTAGGRYSESGTEQTAAARTLAFASIQTAGYSRFDAIVYNLTSDQYEIITGDEGDEPTTPGFDERTNLRVTYILIDDNGGQVQTPPNDHVQNTDTFLDFGGANQISAAQAKEAYDQRHVQNTDTTLDTGGPNEVTAADLKTALDKLGYFAGYFPTEADLTSQPTGMPATDAFALVGSPVGLWVYELDTDTWTLPAGTGGGGSVSYDEPYTFQFFSDLDTVSAVVTLFGPKEFVSPEYSPKLTGVSYEVKLSSTGPPGGASYTAQADLTALNSWITANATTGTTAYDLRLIADYGTSTGEASATIYETKNLSA